MILAQRRAMVRMKHQGIVPKHQVLDNEILAAYRKEIWATYTTFQLVPPDDHHCNLAEKAIQTWKYHFIGVMSGKAATFPVHLWCQAILQAERQPFAPPKTTRPSQGLSIRPGIWAARLQCGAICSHRNVNVCA